MNILNPEHQLGAEDQLKVLEMGSPHGLYGAERWILALMKYLDRKKIHPWVAVIRDDPHLPASLCLESEKRGYLTHVFECSGRYNRKAVALVRRFILTHGIDILHTHGYKTDLIGLLAVRGTRCKIVTTPHGWTKQPDPMLWLYEMFDRLIFPFFDAVVPLSDSLNSGLCRIPGLNGKLQVIRNGVDISEIEGITGVSDELMEWKRQGAFVIGYIGRLTVGKGLDVLLQALVQSGRQNWRVAIFGEGEQLGELISLVKRLRIDSQVKFFGYREDRISFLKCFDVFVLPSRSEGIPRCVMEAMSARIPVIASNIQGCRYLVDHLKTGLLFQTDNEKELVDAICRIEDEPGLRSSLRETAFDSIQATYSAARMAYEYEVLFYRLSGKTFKNRQMKY